MREANNRNDYTFKVVGHRVPRHHRSTAAVRSFIGKAVVAVSVIAGLVAVSSATMLTAQQAEADVFSDIFCINANEAPKSWTDGADRFAPLGGSTGSMTRVNAATNPNAVLTQSDIASPEGVKSLTALEKYGSSYPQFEAWQPARQDRDFNFRGVSANGGLTGDKDNPAIPQSSQSSPVPKSGNSMLSTSWLACQALDRTIEAAVANMLASPPKLLMSFATTTYDAAATGGITVEGGAFEGLAEKIDEVVAGDGGLRDTLFVPFVLPLILIGAIWVGYVGIVKRQAMHALQSTVYMVAAIALGTVFLAQPTLIARGLDNITAEMQTVLNDSLPVTVTSPMCETKGKDASKRSASCVMWENAVYEPWQQGQFGVTLEEDPRNILKDPAYRIFYGDRAVQADTWAQFHLDRQATGKAMQVSEVAYAQLSGVNGETNRTWAGGTGNQLTAAVTMWFTVPAAALIPMFFGALQVIYQIMTSVAMLVSPFFFLFGIVPNWGRRILARFGELLVSILIKRVMLSVFTGIYFTLYALVASAQMNLVLDTIVVAAVGIGVLVARKKIIRLIPEPNFGGNKSIGLPGAKAGAVAAGVAGTVAGAGLLGGIFAAGALRKEGRSLEGKGETRFEGSPVSDVKAPKLRPSEVRPTPVTPSPVSAPVAPVGGGSGSVGTAPNPLPNAEAPAPPNPGSGGAFPTPQGGGTSVGTGAAPAARTFPSSPPPTTQAVQEVQPKNIGKSAGAAASVAHPAAGVAVEAVTATAGEVASGGEGAAQREDAKQAPPVRPKVKP